MLFDNDIYPKERVDTSNVPVQELIEVTPELVNNPVKLCLSALGSMANADVLWASNHIRNPYKELYLGRILQLPFIDMITAPKTKSNRPKTVTLKHAKKDGNQLVY